MGIPCFTDTFTFKKESGPVTVACWAKADIVVMASSQVINCFFMGIKYAIIM